MTLEQKAKAYDEAIERAKSFELPEYKNIMKSVFPELKESGDERIKKALCKAIWTYVPTEEGQEYIAWLEKQGELVNSLLEGLDNAHERIDELIQKNNELCIKLEKQGEQKEYTFKPLPRLLDMIEPTSKAKAYCQKLIDILVKEGYATDAKIVGESLKIMNGEDVPMAIMDEMQGEQKPILDFKAKDWYVSKVDGKIHNMYYSVDKVEPKFKVGDWIIRNAEGFKHNTYLVTEIKDYYVCEELKGRRVTFTFNDVHKNFKLWDISDAKNGDVLFQDLMGGKTFIYNGINPDMAVLYSFIISNDGEDVLSYHIGKPNTGIGNIEENKNIVHPATKEQRNLLFQKMKEAGYEWDSEKKKLKKIEHIDDYKGLTNFERAVADVCIGWIGKEPGWKQYIIDNADILLKIAIKKFNSAQDAFLEPKPAYLEEFINELSKQFPDVSFAKLSRIAIRVAKWAKPTDEEMKELLRTEYEKGRADTIAEMQKFIWSEKDIIK